MVLLHRAEPNVTTSSDGEDEIASIAPRPYATNATIAQRTTHTTIAQASEFPIVLKSAPLRADGSVI